MTKRTTPGPWTVGAALLLSLTGTACTPEPEPQSAPAPVDEIQVVLRGIAATSPPEMAQGKELFAQNCSVCHGPAGDGTTQGPPLVHIIYEPNHHADAALHSRGTKRRAGPSLAFRGHGTPPRRDGRDGPGDRGLHTVAATPGRDRIGPSQGVGVGGRTSPSGPKLQLQGQRAEHCNHPQRRLPFTVPHVTRSGETSYGRS